MNNDILVIKPESMFLTVEPFLSFSLMYHLKDVKNQIQQIIQNENEESTYSLEQLIKMINPYEFIFTKLPNSKFSVSKLKPFSSVFYDFLEIMYTLNLFETLEEKEIKTLHIGKNHPSTIECINMIRENNNDNHLSFNHFADYENDASTKEIEKNSVFFSYYEQPQSYVLEKESIVWMLKTLLHIFTFQKKDGIAIIKIEDVYYKPVIDIIYILCNYYEKVYIIKPNSSNLFTSDKFIVCKKMTSNQYESGLIEKLQNMLSYIEKDESFNCSSLIENEIPYFFINKLEEFNIITGQQQLNAFNQIIHILKTKNKEDKIDNLKKINIQKCISWCDKYKIPSNKFNEKNNIFLPLIKIEKEEVPIDAESEIIHLFQL
jgi:hypothetical protein